MKKLTVGALSFAALLATGAANGAQYDLSSLFMSSGNPQTTLAYGNNKVHDEMVNCPDTSCMVALVATDQFCPVDVSAQQQAFRIRIYVDGVLKRDTWVWGRGDGPAGVQIACRGAESASNVGISSGAHTMSLYTYWPWQFVPATQGAWTVNYFVSTPHH
ncbi:MAG TPA: hypothetical protein VIM02_07085 [Rhizomicrobium sp.]|jgi:hypothetical protein